MDQAKIEKYKEELLVKQRELLEEAKRLEQVTDFGDDVDSLEEESDEDEEYGNQLSVAGAVKNRLADIEMALERIRDGKYGVCAKCGREISEEVLDAAPESNLCKDCKQ